MTVTWPSMLTGLLVRRDLTSTETARATLARWITAGAAPGSLTD